MAVVIVVLIVVGICSVVGSRLLAMRDTKRLTAQNERLAAHVERLTFAFVAKIPDALSGTVIYDKIGQQIGVQRLVVDLYDRVMADPDLRPFFQGIDMDKLRSHQVSMYQALFGLAEYDGMDLSIVHADLGIESRHFDLLMAHVRATLESFGLSVADASAVMGWLELQRAGIVDDGPDGRET